MTLDNIFNIEVSILFQARRGEENLPRLLAISLSGLSFPEIAKRYRIKSDKTIAPSCFRLKEKMKKSTKIKSEYTKLKKLCS
ncbi:MAG: hypothetical protein GY941_10240 [Planctomycetes bacterium]|nr:hypothetical protein [Planctomycetota bacterium]